MHDCVAGHCHMKKGSPPPPPPPNKQGIRAALLGRHTHSRVELHIQKVGIPPLLGLTGHMPLDGWLCCPLPDSPFEAGPLISPIWAQSLCPRPQHPRLAHCQPMDDPSLMRLSSKSAPRLFPNQHPCSFRCGVCTVPNAPPFSLYL